MKRDLYLNRLIERRENGLIKVIIGIRRCGKSYLLFKLYHNYFYKNRIDKSRRIVYDQVTRLRTFLFFMGSIVP
ncbi:AAA family ATPase [Schaedlerella arabinosiphila]|uniref:AAA family ATPase n=1 Tax=Schaedlerella arabinosiphila TaxID=2044587 RepID=A0A9X5H5T5_9FIRM|nr:AAA family ATPase [Schaedlerella arabinosiphila]